MAEDNKKDEKVFEGEKKLPEVIGRLDAVLQQEFAGRPYLLVIASGYEIGKDGDKTTLASQWSWRSNVKLGGEDSTKMMDFLTGQLKEVTEHEKFGVKKFYENKK